jgi:hypothetical protein
MTVNKAIALSTLVSVGVITIADAPQWEIEPYIGIMAAMGGVALIGQASPALGKSMAGLIATVMILRRGNKALTRLTTLVN